ncbi:MAG: MmcQ/YjbR family DNA-binding protein [Eubacteriales bacterium]
MKKETVIDFGLSLPWAYQDFPFQQKMDYCVLRHQKNKKIFALIFEKEEQTWVNVKVLPMEGDFLRQSYEAIVPAYHMNKKHWVSVILDGSISEEIIKGLIEKSYELTQK